MNPYTEILTRALYNKKEIVVLELVDIAKVQDAVQFMNCRTYGARFELSTIVIDENSLLVSGLQVTIKYN